MYVAKIQMVNVRQIPMKSWRLVCVIFWKTDSFRKNLDLKQFFVVASNYMNRGYMSVKPQFSLKCWKRQWKAWKAIKSSLKGNDLNLKFLRKKYQPIVDKPCIQIITRDTRLPIKCMRRQWVSKEFRLYCEDIFQVPSF